MGFVSTNNHQLQIFEIENPKHKPLTSTIDNLNANYEITLTNQDLKRKSKMFKKG